jgi:alanine dehydrogenase
MPLLLSEADVRALLPIDELIQALRAALGQFSAGRVVQPLRTVMALGGGSSFVGVMPAAMQEPPALGTKLVTVFRSNAAAGLPTHLATIVLLDSTTGELLAVLDGRYITEVRTAAVSAIATDLLARQDATTLALIGSGVQARSHLEAIAHVRPVREVRVWSPNPEHRSAFARELQPRSSAVLRACTSAREAVEAADIIVLVTASAEPVVQNSWVADGAHVCAVGACRPDQREMETALVARARLFVDSRTAALAEAGDIVLPLEEGVFGEDHIAGEIGDLLLGRVPGRQAQQQVTIFKSLGLAVEDVAAAHVAYTRATERGLGRGFAL